MLDAGRGARIFLNWIDHKRNSLDKVPMPMLLNRLVSILLESYMKILNCDSKCSGNAIIIMKDQYPEVTQF
jgi:hypothetical protein